MQALLVAPNLDEREIFGFILKHVGLSVANGRDLINIANKWLERPADLIVVAVNRGDTLHDGLIELRQVTQAPCLVIIEPPTEESLCQILHSGADVVLSRPVAPAFYQNTCGRSRAGCIMCPPLFCLASM
ncbi:MAG: hypothetical protein M5U34_48560 [Chloroflexi bacterium]|nr:hypothetical protein [Chloroflexota bacterium]